MFLTDFSLINIRSSVSFLNKLVKRRLFNTTSKENLFKKNRYLLIDRKTIRTMSDKKLIAICQMTCGADKQENFNICKQLIVSAAKDGAKVYLV